MISVFVDETGDSKFDNYMGICLAAINTARYPAVKREFQNILQRYDWNPKLEFKGSFLFSAKNGDTSVSVENRVAIARELIALNKSARNARIKFYYCSRKSVDHKSDYLKYLPVLLEKALPKAKKRGGKDLLAFHYDQRSDIKPAEVRNVIGPFL